MLSKERFKVLNKIRNNPDLVRKCQICGRLNGDARIETIINESNHNKIKFVCTDCRYGEDTKALVSKLPEIDLDDCIKQDILNTNIEKLVYSDEMFPYIQEALTTNQVKTQFLKSRHISPVRFNKFISLYEAHTKLQVEEQIYDRFKRNNKISRVQTLNNKDEEDLLNSRNNIDKFRLEQNLSYRELALKTNLNLTNTTIYYIAEGKYKPKKNSMVLIAKALNKKPIEVFPNDWIEE